MEDRAISSAASFGCRIAAAKSSSNKELPPIRIVEQRAYLTGATAITITHWSVVVHTGFVFLS